MTNSDECWWLIISGEIPSTNWSPSHRLARVLLLGPAGASPTVGAHRCIISAGWSMDLPLIPCPTSFVTPSGWFMLAHGNLPRSQLSHMFCSFLDLLFPRAVLLFKPWVCAAEPGPSWSLRYFLLPTASCCFCLAAGLPCCHVHVRGHVASSLPTLPRISSAFHTGGRYLTLLDVHLGMLGWDPYWHEPATLTQLDVMTCRQ